MKPIRIFLTGGTIDKTYDNHGDFHYNKSYIPELMQKSRCSVEYSIEELMLKDSFDLSFSDRVLIRERCERCEEDTIIIIHGTDRIVQTAHAVSTIQNKLIILVGSIVPASVSLSDAEFNLGSAIAYSQALSNGTYIAMNGQAIVHDNVRKNMENLQFENIY